MEQTELQRAIEAILFAAGEPVEAVRMAVVAVRQAAEMGLEAVAEDLERLQGSLRQIWLCNEEDSSGLESGCGLPCRRCCGIYLLWHALPIW